RHGCRLDFNSGCNQLLNRTKGTSAILFANGVGAASVGVHDRGQSHGFALPFQLPVNTGVITSESAYADYGDVDGLGGQCSVASRLVAARRPDCRMVRYLFEHFKQGVEHPPETQYREVDRLPRASHHDQPWAGCRRRALYFCANWSGRSAAATMMCRACALKILLFGQCERPGFL